MMEAQERVQAVVEMEVEVAAWAFILGPLLMLIGFLRDNESEKPYKQKVNKKKGSRVKRQHQMQVD
jgi:hypothetical protein